MRGNKQELTQLCLRAAGCRYCFEHLTLSAPLIDMAQPRWGVKGQFAPPACDWFLGKGPTTYANINLGRGSKKVYARLKQFEFPISVPE